MMRKKNFLAILLAVFMVIALTPTMMLAEENVIVHQPTAGEPYMDLKDETGVAYQWYSVTEVKDYITDADILTSMGARKSDTIENCWVSTGGHLFRVEFSAGDVVVFDIVEGDAGKISVFSGPTQIDITTTGTGKYILEIPESAQYIVSADIALSAKIYVHSLELGAAIDGETASVLSQKELGKYYCCKATTAAGVLTSDFFEYKIAISHQPTGTEPYVDFNENTEATYQWYSYFNGDWKVTEEEVEEIGLYGSTGVSYDTTKGWNDTIGGGGGMFSIKLEQGQVLKIVPDGSVQGFSLTIPNTYNEYYATAQGDGSYTITATETNTYDFNAISMSPDTYLQIYLVGEHLEAVAGQTSATFTSENIGDHICVVTYPDGTTEQSKVFCAHAWADGVCTLCSEEHACSSAKEDGECPVCGYEVEGLILRGSDKLYRRSIEDVLAIAQDGDTIQLLQDVITAGSLTISKAITLDLNGHTIQVPTGANMTINAAVVLKDSVGTGGLEHVLVYFNSLCKIESVLLNGQLHFEAEGYTAEDYLAEGFLFYSYDEATNAIGTEKLNVDGLDSLDYVAVAKCKHVWSEGNCTNCGVSCTHDWGEYVSNQDATCKADGTKTAECDICGKKDTVTDTGSKLAHLDANKDGKCDSCGEIMSTGDVPNAGDGSNADSMPDTGDNAPITLWVMLMMLGAGVMLIGIKRRARL